MGCFTQEAVLFVGELATEITEQLGHPEQAPPISKGPMDAWLESSMDLPIFLEGIRSAPSITKRHSIVRQPPYRMDPPKGSRECYWDILAISARPGVSNT